MCAARLPYVLLARARPKVVDIPKSPGRKLDVVCVCSLAPSLMYMSDRRDGMAGERERERVVQLAPGGKREDGGKEGGEKGLFLASTPSWAGVAPTPPGRLGKRVEEETSKKWKREGRKGS